MLPNLGRSPIIFSNNIINSDIWTYIFFQSRPGADPDFLKRGANRGPKPKFSLFFKGFSPKQEPAPSCRLLVRDRLCTQSGVE